MDLDEELDTMEDGAETEAEQTDEETELQDLEDFEDEGLGVDAEETDLEDAYEEFYYSEEGPEVEGESSDADVYKRQGESIRSTFEPLCIWKTNLQ